MINPFKFLGSVYLMVIVLILLPTFLLLMPFWWVIAWILEQIFPQRDIFPINKICSRVITFFIDGFR